MCEPMLFLQVCVTMLSLCDNGKQSILTLQLFCFISFYLITLVQTPNCSSPCHFV